jgi:hypothetical protein
MNHVYAALLVAIVTAMYLFEVTRPCAAFNNLPCDGQRWEVE